MTPWWSTASIRVRLTAWYALVLSLMLVVYASATFVAVRHEFFEQFDDQLHDDFEAAEGFLTPTDGGRITWSGDRRHDPDDDEDRGSDVWLAGGEQVLSIGRVRIVASGGARGDHRGETVRIDRREWSSVADAHRHNPRWRTRGRLEGVPC